jgi:predicted Zn-dependent protease
MRRTLIALAVTLLAASLASAHDDAVTLQRLGSALARGDEPAARLLLRAEIERADGNWTAAEKDLARAARLVPGSAPLARCRAALALDRGRPADALRDLDACGDPELSTDPRVPWLRADALLRLARLDDAARVMDAALTHDAELTPERFLARASLAERRPGEGASGAIAILASGLAHWPGAWTLLDRLVDLEVGLGRLDDALARLDAFMSRVQRPEWVLMRRGDVLALAGREWEAREAWTTALDGLEARPVMDASAREMAGRLRASLSAPIANGGIH